MKSLPTLLFRHFLPLFFLCSFAEGARAQETALITENHKMIETDKLGNIYLVSDFEITKYSFSGRMLSRYSSKANGKIASLDVSNPLKLLVFYRDFSMVLFLDNMLNVQGDPIAFEMIGMARVTQTCTGFDNSFWVYDSDVFEVKRLNSKLEISGRSGNLFTVLKKEIKPLSIQEYLNQLYLLGSDSTLYVFDAFGSYVKSWKMNSVGPLRVASPLVYQLGGESLFVFDTKSLNVNYRNLPVGGCNELAVNGESILWGNGQQVFRISR